MQKINAVSLGDAMSPAAAGMSNMTSSTKGISSVKNFQTVMGSAGKGQAIRKSAKETMNRESMQKGATKAEGFHKDQLSSTGTGNSNVTVKTRELVSNVQRENGFQGREASLGGSSGRMPDATLKTVTEAIGAVVEDVLQLDENEFQAVLAQMGITAVNLLEPGTLQQFTIQVCEGTDVTDFLTNEDMLSAFQDLTQGFDEIDWQALTGMTGEELVQQVDAMMLREPENQTMTEGMPENHMTESVTDTIDEAFVSTKQSISEEPLKTTVPMVETFQEPRAENGSEVMTSRLEEAYPSEEGVHPTQKAVAQQPLNEASARMEEQSSNQVFVQNVDRPLVTETAMQQSNEKPLDQIAMPETLDAVLKEAVDEPLREIPMEGTERSNASAMPMLQTKDSVVMNGTEENVAAELSDEQLMGRVFVQNGNAAEQNSMQFSRPREMNQPILPSQEAGAATVLGFVDQMMQAVGAEQVPEQVDMQQMIDIVNQVVERIRSTVDEGSTTMEMQLNPERLGRLLLSVTHKNGVMTASFTVQTTEAKVALESQMITLRESLEQKNLKVEAVEVSVSDFEFSQSGQAAAGDQKQFEQGNGRRLRFQLDNDEAGDEESVISDAEVVRRNVMRDNGGSIDYTA